MNTRFASALLLSLTLASTSVMADGRGRDRGDDRGHSHGYSQRDDRGHYDKRDRDEGRYERESRRDRRDDRRDDRYSEYRRDDRRDRHGERAYYDGARHYHKGDRINSRYRDRVYYVNDWGHHHLHRPPRGHVWVQVGGDYVLMAVATGIIASIILNH